MWAGGVVQAIQYMPPFSRRVGEMRSRCGDVACFKAFFSHVRAGPLLLMAVACPALSLYRARGT